MLWLDRFTWPREAISNLQADVMAIRLTVLQIPTQLNRMEKHMADVSPLLNKLAEDLRAFGAGPFAAVLAENTALKARNADLEGEDVAETGAAENAVAAFNELANPVTESPEVPVDIEPVEVPTEEAPAEEPPAEPTPAA